MNEAQGNAGIMPKQNTTLPDYTRDMIARELADRRVPDPRPGAVSGILPKLKAVR